MSYSSAQPWRAVAGMGSRPALQTAAGVVGAVFLLVGILGFIPGVTTNYGDMQFAGHESGAMLFGVFQVSILHNLVHLAFGVLGLALARSLTGATLYLIIGGIVYLALWLYGVAVGQETPANFIPLNAADDWLHLLLGIGMIALGVIGRAASPRR